MNKSKLEKEKQLELEVKLFMYILHLKEEKNKRYSIKECEKNIAYVFDNYEEFKCYFISFGFLNIDEDLLEICTMKTTKKGKIIALKWLCDYVIRKHNQNNLSIDNLIEELKKVEKIEQEEKNYNQPLIPSGGTTDWLTNCHERNYRTCGYTEHLISVIKISADSRIEISDFTQPGSNGEDEEFFTSITFYKKELIKKSEISFAHIYDRSYSIYYPYRTGFNEKLLSKIGYALSGLINEARDLDNIKENQEKLWEIYNQQKQLIKLFIAGTNDKMAVEKIVGSTRKIFVDGKVREAWVKKDYLPYCECELYNNVEELKQNKVLKK